MVTLQRPDKRNALSIDLRVELADAFTRLAGDDSVACIVLTGAGTAFCSGMDTSQFGGDPEHRRRLVETSTGAFHAVGRCPKPVLAAVNGPALAGGFALALLCDMRIAARVGDLRLCGGRDRHPGELCGRACRAQPGGRAGPVPDRARGRSRRGGAARHRERGVRRTARCSRLRSERAESIARLPRAAVLETKRRIILDGERTWGALFDEEERAFRAALLEGEPEPAA